MARALRSAIQFVELPGGAGRDRWLYAVAASVVLVAGGRRASCVAVGAGSCSAWPRCSRSRPSSSRTSDATSTRRTSSCGARSGATTSPPGSDETSRGRPRTSPGTARSACCSSSPESSSRSSRFGGDDCRGSAVLLALAPVYWLVALSALLFYQDAAGRFFMAPVALAGATWGLAARVRWAAWGLTAIGVTTLALAVLNDSKRPSGVPLLERPAPPSYFTEPRWSAQGREVFVPELIRFVDERVPADARGRARDHAERPRVRRSSGPRSTGASSRSAPARSTRRARPGRSSVRLPAASTRLCAAWRRLPVRPSGWDVHRRPAGRC